MQMKDTSCQMATTLCFAALACAVSQPVHANDIFVGKYASETRENFGRDSFGEYEISVVRMDGSYVLTVSQNRKVIFKVDAVPCDPDKEGYLRGRPSGNAYALCNTSYGSPVLVYSQNGIKDPMADLYRAKGLPSPRAEPYYRAQYYAHIQWGFYGFRKIE